MRDDGVIKIDLSEENGEKLAERKRLKQPSPYLRALSAGLLFLSGCATPQYIDYDSIQFKGDMAPMVGSKEAAAGDFSKLTEGESIVVAIASDGSGALSQPNLAAVSVIEALLSNRNNSDSIDLIRSRCDFDGDGIWDRYCPELLNSRIRQGLSSEQFVAFDSLYTLSRSTSNRDQWMTSAIIDRSNSKSGAEPIYLQLLSINRGNKTYTGDLNVHIRLPAQVIFDGVSEAYQVRDQRETKGNLAMVPFLGMVTHAMSDYFRVEGHNAVTHSYDPEDGLVVRFKDITLRPQDGIRVQYKVVYPLDQAGAQ